MRQADWFLYECAACGEKTFLGPAGGALNECSCESPSDALVTALYADNPEWQRVSMRDLTAACGQGSWS